MLRGKYNTKHAQKNFNKLKKYIKQINKNNGKSKVDGQKCI